jgi:hypothetical protein
MEIDTAHQWLPELRNIAGNAISYEGLRERDDYGKASLKGVTPVATGDGPKWIKGNPAESMFSIYSSSPVGIFGAIIDTTNVEGILRLDCNATDFYAEKPYPTYLYYNPYQENKRVAFHLPEKADLFDIVSGKYAATGAASGTFEIAPDQASLIVVLPAGTNLSRAKEQVIADNKYIISYH